MPFLSTKKDKDPIFSHVKLTFSHVNESHSHVFGFFYM